MARISNRSRSKVRAAMSAPLPLGPYRSCPSELERDLEKIYDAIAVVQKYKRGCLYGFGHGGVSLRLDITSDGVAGIMATAASRIKEHELKGER